VHTLFQLQRISTGAIQTHSDNKQASSFVPTHRHCRCMSFQMIFALMELATEGWSFNQSVVIHPNILPHGWDDLKVSIFFFYTLRVHTDIWNIFLEGCFQECESDMGSSKTGI